jgi:acyl homoserine lactone synthase
MHHTVNTKTLREMSEKTRTAMFRLRHDTFVTRLGWVTPDPQGLEHDKFDELPTVRYIIASDPLADVDACWRLLPTVGPYMLKDLDVFRQLMHGEPIPCAGDVWELSRFAVAAEKLSADESAGNQQVGFGPLSVAMMGESVRFARDNGIARYITVTNTAIERMLKKLGVNVHRVGPPVRIGNVMTVADIIEIDDVTATALGV